MTITSTRGSTAAIPGRDGADWLSGQGAPAASLGPVRSLYFDELTANTYRKSREGWSLMTNIGGKSPILAVVSDGARRVLKVTGWVGSGTKPPVDVYVGSGDTYVLSIDSAVDIRGPQGIQGIQGDPGIVDGVIEGDVYIGSEALATTATAGFLHLPSCPGIPTGTPANLVAGMVPLVVDSTNDHLYAYIGGAWVNLSA